MLVTTVVDDDKRPCYARGQKAILHRWVELSYPMTQLLALVEYEDGSIAQVKPTSIKFADGGDFDAYEWEDEEDDKSENNAENTD